MQHCEYCRGVGHMLKRGECTGAKGKRRCKSVEERRGIQEKRGRKSAEVRNVEVSGREGYCRRKRKGKECIRMNNGVSGDRWDTYKEKCKEIKGKCKKRRNEGGNMTKGKKITERKRLGPKQAG